MQFISSTTYYSVAQYALHIKKEACVDSSEVLTLEVVQAKPTLAVLCFFNQWL